MHDPCDLNTGVVLVYFSSPESIGLPATTEAFSELIPFRSTQITKMRKNNKNVQIGNYCILCYVLLSCKSEKKVSKSQLSSFSIFMALFSFSIFKYQLNVS